jgi:hypothetical protein
MPSTSLLAIVPDAANLVRTLAEQQAAAAPA